MICLGSADEIEEGTSKGYEANGAYLFAVKRDANIYLYLNNCPHLGTPLEWQEDTFLDPDGALIQCSTHGALFAIDSGRCLAGPCKGQYLQAVPFLLDQGLIMVEEDKLRYRNY